MTDSGGYPHYVFECGCETDRHPGYFFQRKNGHPQKFIELCPVHGLPVKYKRYKCKECGETFLVDYKVNNRAYCDNCKKKKYTTKQLAQRAKRNRKGKIKKKKKKKFPQGYVTKRNWDCIYYLKCLMPTGKLMKDAGACLTCKKYKKEKQRRS